MENRDGSGFFASQAGLSALQSKLSVAASVLYPPHLGSPPSDNPGECRTFSSVESVVLDHGRSQ